MIKHIVMFRFKEPDRNLIRFKNELDELKNKIEEIKYFETGVNISKVQNAYDLVLLSEFESAESLEKYKVHPEHLKIVSFLNEIKEDVKVVDYEF